MTFHLRNWAPVRGLSGQPSAWAASSFPFTFVVTETRSGRFAASAQDCTADVPRADLGTRFSTREAAMEACEIFRAAAL